MTDRKSLYLAAFVRSLATGMIGVLLGVYLAELRLDAGAIGVIIGAGLAGATLATLLVTLLGDRFGRRRSLVIIAALGFLGAVLLAFSAHPLVLGAAAFLGMVNGMGRDRGAALVLEQAILPDTTSDRERTMAFARYNVLQDIGHALGALLAAMPALLQPWVASETSAFRFSIATYAALCLLPCIVYVRLSFRVERSHLTARERLSPQSRKILWRISSLFALDSLGGGFLTTALLSLFFHERFGASVESIAALFFCARILNAASHIAAAWLASRIGLVNTMVFTHMPSSVLLITVAFAPSFAVAAALFLLREGLVEMDVPTRQSYVMAMVGPQERTLASGVTHLVRLGAWAVAPMLAGFLMTGSSLAAPLIVGAAMKLLYDLLLWRAFRSIRPPEESAIPGAVADSPARATTPSGNE
ncbi:MAG TPA: MFS transporter [Povalibacter sp.]